MTKANIILEYLQQIGAKKETEMYLNEFLHVELGRFALIMIDAKTLSVYHRDVGASLAYLSSLGLSPIVMHDATGALGKQLVSDIWANGGKCQEIMAGVYSNQGKETAKSIAKKAGELISTRTMPIIETEDLAGMLHQLLPLAKPGKLIFLNRFGGVRTKKDALISYINLPNEYDAVKKIAAAEYLQMLKLVNSLLKSSDWKLHVEIVPPNGLLTELFTIKGSGTFVKKGPKIMELKSSAVDKAKLKALLEASFGKKLSRRYFMEEGNVLFFVEENYRGAAVVKNVKGISYIDKLAVMPEAQGEGLARDLITSVMNKCTRVFWRANPDNHINEWYFKLCSGVQKESKWHVYWSNLSLEQIKTAVDYALKKPADFVS